MSGNFGQLPAALFQAAQRGNIDVLRSILDAVPNAILVEDEDEDSLLHAACYGNQPSVVAFLLSRGMDVDTVGCSARVPIDCAAHEGFFDCVHILLANNCDIDWGDALNENTIHKAAAKGHKEILQLILEMRKPNASVINRQNVLGSTPLHLALERGNIECAELLVRFGANPKIQDFFGFFPTYQPKRNVSSTAFQF